MNPPGDDPEDPKQCTRLNGDKNFGDIDDSEIARNLDDPMKSTAPFDSLLRMARKVKGIPDLDEVKTLDPAQVNGIKHAYISTAESSKRELTDKDMRIIKILVNRLNTSRDDESYKVFTSCSISHAAIKVERTTFYKTEKLIYEQTALGFIKWSVSDNTWETVAHIHTGIMIDNPNFKIYKDGTSNGVPALVEVVYYPLIDKAVEEGQITLAKEPEECNDILSILKEIEEKSRKWIYIAPEELPIFRIQIRIAVASWFLYVFDGPRIPEKVAGLLSIVGVSGGGKKRFLTILRMIAYRPIYTLNSTKIPSTFRLLEPWGDATLLIDEADQRDTGSEAEWIQFLNARYDGTPISRYNSTTGRNDMFRSFGLSALALRRMPKDEGTISRKIKINATISPVALPEVAGKDIYKDFESIRNKLLYLRLKHYGKLYFIGESGLPPEHSWRGKEVLTLIKVLAEIDPQIEADLQELSKELTEKEVINLSQSWDGVVINEIYEFIVDEETERREIRNGLCFVKSFMKDGEVKYTALTLNWIAKSLGTTATDIKRTITPFKIDVIARKRLDGIDKQIRGLLNFTHLEETDRIFARYVVGYNHELKDLMEQTTFREPTEKNSTASTTENKDDNHTSDQSETPSSDNSKDNNESRETEREKNETLETDESLHVRGTSFFSNDKNDKKNSKGSIYGDSSASSDSNVLPDVSGTDGTESDDTLLDESSGDWGYFRVKENFTFGKYTYHKGSVSKFPILKAGIFIEKGVLEIPCPHGQIWDPVSKECIVNEGEDGNV